jgi:sulfoxide reductase heme-binding subunit YedZ
MFAPFRAIRFSKLQIGVHLVFWVLVVWLGYDAIAGNLGINPIQLATQRTGKYALVFLTASLACTPVNTLLGWRQALTARRALGVYAFLWAAVHFSIFIWIDYAFAWEFIKIEILDKRYILAGLAALCILTPLALTSFKWWQKRLGKKWKRLHKLVYLAAPLVILHYSWAKKGDIFQLTGDILQPLLFGLAIGLLLLARLAFVRRHAARLRSQLKARLFPASVARLRTERNIPKGEGIDRPATSSGDF